jgi:hypothetical protein
MLKGSIVKFGMTHGEWLNTYSQNQGTSRDERNILDEDQVYWQRPTLIGRAARDLAMGGSRLA